LARVTEVSEGGSVPELAFENDAGCRVLLVDGEEFGRRTPEPGAQPLDPGRGEEQGGDSGLLRRAGALAVCLADVRLGKSVTCTQRRGRKKMAQVTHSLRSAGTRHSDQSRIWESIADKAECMASYSETSAMADIYEQQQTKLKEYASAFAPQDFQVGAVFTINGRVVGADLFDAPRPSASS